MSYQPLPSEQKTFAALFDNVARDGQIAAMDAANFLRQSELPDITLHKIWEHSDPNGRGFLDRPGFYTAMKLVALCQNNGDIDNPNYNAPTPLPNLGAASKAVAHLAPKASDVAPPSEWSISAQDLERYKTVFKSLEPDADGNISGKKARQVLMKSKLSTPVLGRVWEISDINKDGKLNSKEFAIAMYLVSKALEGADVPDSLPAGVETSAGGAGGSNAGATAASTGGSGAPDWVVSDSEKATYDGFFKSADKDKDGLVSGGEIMSIFMSSKLPKNVLAHVWNLCDIKQTGQLNAEQFALAMHIISRKVKGTEVPDKLAPNMVPPSMREGNSAPAPAAVAPAPAPAKEPAPVKAPVKAAAAKPEPAKPAPTPPASSSADSGSAVAEEMNKLASAKADAEKSLAEAKRRKDDVAKQVSGARGQLEQEKKAIADLEAEIAKQNSEAKAQESELNKVNADLAKLKEEEKRLRAAVKQGKEQVTELMNKIKAAKAEQAKVQATVSRLNEHKGKIDASLAQYSGAAERAASAAKSGKTKVDGFKLGPSGGADPFSSGPAKKTAPNTHGMSFEDYFGESNPATSKPSSSNPWA